MATLLIGVLISLCKLSYFDPGFFTCKQSPFLLPSPVEVEELMKDGFVQYPAHQASRDVTTDIISQIGGGADLTIFQSTVSQLEIIR